MAATEGNPMQVKVHGFSSNARRAARARGLDPDQVVKQNPDGLGFVIGKPAVDDFPDMPEALMREPPTKELEDALLAKAQRSHGATREITLPKTTAPRKKTKIRAAPPVRHGRPEVSDRECGADNQACAEGTRPAGRTGPAPDRATNIATIPLLQQPLCVPKT